MYFMSDGMKKRASMTGRLSGDMEYQRAREQSAKCRRGKSKKKRVYADAGACFVRGRILRLLRVNGRS
jgi:hypothetical protein